MLYDSAIVYLSINWRTFIITETLFEKLDFSVYLRFKECGNWSWVTLIIEHSWYFTIRHFVSHVCAPLIELVLIRALLAGYFMFIYSPSSIAWQNIVVSIEFANTVLKTSMFVRKQTVSWQYYYYLEIFPQYDSYNIKAFSDGFCPQYIDYINGNTLILTIRTKVSSGKPISSSRLMNKYNNILRLF